MNLRFGTRTCQFPIHQTTTQQTKAVLEVVNKTAAYEELVREQFDPSFADQEMREFRKYLGDHPEAKWSIV
jgi:hypothetical protein